MTDVTLDRLAIEGPLLQRIGDTAPVLRTLGTATDFAALGATAPALPAVFVRWVGDQPLPPSGPGRGAALGAPVRQTWAVGVFIDLAGARYDGSGGRASLGPILARLDHALRGWRPPDVAGVSHLERVQGAAPLYDWDRATLIAELRYAAILGGFDASLDATAT